MTSSPYKLELRTALLAVQRAARLTQAVYASSQKGTLTKDDHSPVTIGDFGAQALIIKALTTTFPSDEIIAEEESSDLRTNAALLKAVWDSVKAAQENAPAEEKVLGEINDEEELMALLDQGGSEGGKDKVRVWTLDPIDGTKGFLRGGQYAIALALLEKGEPVVGVLGCPNLPREDGQQLDTNVGHDQSGSGADVGVIVSAVLGHGAVTRAIDGATGVEHEIRMRQVPIEQAVLCEGVEAAHSNHGQQDKIRTTLGISGESVRLDSQAKYASVARGAGDIYLRLPAGKPYTEKIWDHAAGDLIVKEAGGIVTDIHGKKIDFGIGRYLTGNVGFVVAGKDIHAKVLEGVQKILSEEGKL
jgi:3'(2'), 5'-bisphosphate nucleotidase